MFHPNPLPVNTGKGVFLGYKCDIATQEERLQFLVSHKRIVGHWERSLEMQFADRRERRDCFCGMSSGRRIHNVEYRTYIKDPLCVTIQMIRPS
jgi:hypothetical protein